MRNIFKIIRLAKPLYPIMYSIGFLILLSAILQQLSPIISKFIVDEIELSITGEGGNRDQLFFLIGLAFAANILGLFFSGISDRLGDHFAGKIRKFLTERYYQKVLTLPQSYFDTELSGKIVNQLNRGIVATKDFLNMSTNFIVPTFLQSIFTILILLYYSPPTAFFVFLLFPVYTYLSFLSAKQWGKRENKKNKLEDNNRARIQEVISNIKLVKSFTNEKKEYNFIRNNQDSINEIYAVQSTNYHVYNFLRNFSLEIILLAVNVVVFYNAFQGNLSIGEMVLIIQLVVQARTPLMAMSFILENIQTAESGSKEFFEVLELQSTEDFSTQGNIKKITKPKIEFKNVSFHYEGGKNVLNDVSFVIDKNHKVALVGHSGAGKSTIVNLVLKFYEASKGSISLNGQEYEDISHSFVRNNIALVFQENELFSSTIRENVSYGMQATDDQIWEALKQANAYDFVSKLNDKLDAKVGERGIKLSGGQKQRIQIARAILKDAPIVILDEATSNLDSKSEQEVQIALENLMRDKIVIIIAHRFSTIQNVDRIMVLDSGRIVDSGTPGELASREGIYKDLLQYQVEGNKKLLKNYELS